MNRDLDRFWQRMAGLFNQVEVDTRRKKPKKIGVGENRLSQKGTRKRAKWAK